MGAMAWPAPSPGAPLEAGGDLRPREMTVHDGIRLTGLLGFPTCRVLLRCRSRTSVRHAAMVT